jgi:hypothetical protein
MTTAALEAARPPYPWPDADWTEFTALVREATWAELDERGRLTLPTDLFRAVRRRVFGYLFGVARRDGGKAAWLDGNLSYMVAAACRGLFCAGRLDRAVYAFTTLPCGFVECEQCGNERSPLYPLGCFNVGLTSLVASAGRTGFVAPADWARFSQVSTPPEWAALPLAYLSLPVNVCPPDAWIERPGETTPIPGVRVPKPSSVPDNGHDEPYHPDPAVLQRLAYALPDSDMEASDEQRSEALRAEVLSKTKRPAVRSVGASVRFRFGR